jgi:hypothetical protein
MSNEVQLVNVGSESVTCNATMYHSDIRDALNASHSNVLTYVRIKFGIPTMIWNVAA